MTFLTLTSHRRRLLAASLACTFFFHLFTGSLSAAPPPQATKPPNILFFIMDDVGIDQMTSFGYGGLTPPQTPNINAVARAGVRFRNTWAMPECSPSRAMFFEGRYPLRTNIFSAILALDLANSQVSPFETTTPQVLKKKGYDSGLFGKFHLSGMSNNPFREGVVHALGWDFFTGYLEGAPFPIDTTAGGVGTPVCVGGSNPGTACPNGNECSDGGTCPPSMAAASSPTPRSIPQAVRTPVPAISPIVPALQSPAPRIPRLVGPVWSAAAFLSPTRVVSRRCPAA